MFEILFFIIDYKILFHINITFKLHDFMNIFYCKINFVNLIFLFIIKLYLIYYYYIY